MNMKLKTMTSGMERLIKNLKKTKEYKIINKELIKRFRKNKIQKIWKTN